MVRHHPRHTLQASAIALASGSPRRSELLALTGWPARITPVSVDETPRPGEAGLDLVRRLALAKADSAGAAADHNEIVLAADTAVLNGDRILGKPADRAEAREMLQALRGREHRVLTAIALVDQASGERVVDVCETCVPMRAYGDAEVEAYVASGAVQDKAGAYGIQDHGFDPVPVDQMQGCYANVMGLPLCHLVRSMRRLGLEPPGDVPAACRAHTGYACSVYPGILGAEA